jgi:hypothetical protein
VPPPDQLVERLALAELTPYRQEIVFDSHS